MTASPPSANPRSPAALQPRPVAAFVSLGCSKNTVDSEHLLAHLAKNGFLIAEDPRDADICLVNTCGFIQAARTETAEVLRHLRARTTRRRPPIIVALGCMVERANTSPEMRTFLDAADATVSFSEYPRLPDICRTLLASRCELQESTETTCRPRLNRHPPPSPFLDFLNNSPRIRIGSPHTAYLKISEGCSNPCRFCSIPLIRGTQRSFRMDDVLREAFQLIRTGARELNLIAQDTTSYGRDLGWPNGLARLLEKLAAMNDDVWYRVLYGHPRHITNELLQVMADLPCVCPYLDIPLQHISDRMLRAMGRGMTREKTMACLETICSAVPHIALRTTFIVGFPGETDSDFRQLLDLVSQGLFSHIGVFTFSPEPGTPAARLPDDVPSDVKEDRKKALMLTQQAIRQKQLRNMRGHVVEVMLDEMVSAKNPRTPCPDGTRAIGRTPFDAPEVDGMVFVRGTLSPKNPGDRLKVKVIGSTDYDLIGEPTE